MFRYFETNYVWSTAVNAALEMGAKIGEIDQMCRPLLEIARQGEDVGTQQFMAAWQEEGNKLLALAQEDEAQGRLLSAGEKLNRAAIYYITAERLQAHGYAPRQQLYTRFRETFDKGLALSKQPCRRVEIPYGDKHIAGLFHRPVEGTAQPAPCLVIVNGLDSTKEMVYRTGAFAEMLAARGIASLFVDQPGSGEALRLHAMTAVHDSERWASPIVDYLQSRDDVASDRIGLLGVSLGGYFAPRAVAFEPRFALGAVWGANHNWGEMQKRRLANEGERPVPHYWEHVCWVWGAHNVDEFINIAEKVSLEGVLDKIRVPFLVTHGEEDRQIPTEYAEQSYRELVNSPDRDLKIFRKSEGGSQHSSLDNASNAGNFIADWIAERLGGKTQ